MAIILGIVAAFFFSVTFVLNQLMATSGGDWLWTASLRYLFMLPFFLVIVAQKKELNAVKKAIQKKPRSWFLWSQIGFGLFYLPLTFASTLAPGWLVASTWQITIVAGSILAPFLAQDEKTRQESKLTKSDIVCFGIILVGIFIVESAHFSITSWRNSLIALIVVLIAAFAYPLGNRKIMELNHQGENLSTLARILAMLVCSLPTWLIAAAGGFVRSGWPSQDQLVSSLLVALFSGVIATYLFFQATHLVQHNLKLLATTEATQSLEVVFSLLLGIIILGDSLPSGLTILGIGGIVIGMSLKVIR